MKSRIQNVTQTYTKFENILPDELSHNNNIVEELEISKNEINTIINDDLINIKSLSSSQNKAIPFNEFLKPPSIFKTAFYMESDHSQDPIQFYYAHWTMSLSALRSLAQNIIEISRELKRFYTSYIDATGTHEKGIEFNRFVRAYEDFNGYLTTIHNTIKQYYDLFVRVCNEIDPNNKDEEETLTQNQLDIDYRQLLAAIKELLLHENMGRPIGFLLLRSVLEFFITRELFNTKKSSKYNNNQIIFSKKDIPSPKTIIRIIEKLNLERFFKTDSLLRLWQSIIIHRGIPIDDYLLWFICERTALEILAAFNANLKNYRDQILEELQNEKEIQIK
jgi:hypothetical protein